MWAFCLAAFVGLVSLAQQSGAVLQMSGGVSYQADKYCPKLSTYNGHPINVGCFNTYLGVFHPLTPDEINPLYSFYRYDNQTQIYRRWRWDDPIESEPADLLTPDDRLAVIVHGFTDNTDRPWMPQMRDALFLQPNPERQKVILVDWRKGAEGPKYATAARNVMMLARVSAELIVRLVKKYDIKEKNIHLIGHSLGGQTVGRMTEWLNGQYKIKVGRATGLDVASPLFEERGIKPDKTQAHYFESVHSSGGNSLTEGKFGLLENFSHLDIYPNGGIIKQPGCIQPPTTLHCSHDLSRPYYSELLIICNGGCAFNVTTCASTDEAASKTCTGSKIDICKRMAELNENATDKDSDIVYFETREDELVSSCNKGWKTTLVKSFKDIVQLIKTG